MRAKYPCRIAAYSVTIVGIENLIPVIPMLPYIKIGLSNMVIIVTIVYLIISTRLQ